RVFSQQNLIKTKLRNQMKLSTLNSHLMIVMNGPPLDTFDFEKAYELWKRNMMQFALEHVTKNRKVPELLRLNKKQFLGQLISTML
ncbi:23419_t:CDS:2, partial [Gigaspora margarita]